MSEPLNADEWDQLAASIDHLSGPDAWDDDQLETALIPVTHYVPRLMAEVKELRATTLGGQAAPVDLAADENGQTQPRWPTQNPS